VRRLEGHGHRLCPAEKEWSSGEEQDGWKQDSSKQINVLDWVERHAAKAEGGIIPQSPGSESMSRFVKGDGDKDRHDPRGGGIDGGWNVQVRFPSQVADQVAIDIGY
jgi:hypothetical protein